jgi:predicted nucleotidyltransferase component of viral defense system
MNKPATRGNDTTSNFIRLSPRRQREVLDKGATQSHLSPQLLEKDVWVCWALDAVFRVPDPYDMAFKGGTSLSKGYDAIRRLSEDVDITLDYKSLNPTFADVVTRLQVLESELNA